MLSINRSDLVDVDEEQPLSSTFAAIKAMQKVHAGVCQIRLDVKDDQPDLRIISYQPDYFNSVDKGMMYTHLFPYFSAHDLFAFSATNIRNQKIIAEYSGYLELVNPVKIAYLKARLLSLDERYNKICGIEMEKNRDCPLACEAISCSGICCGGSACSSCSAFTGVACITAEKANCFKITIGVGIAGYGAVVGFATTAITFFSTLNLVNHLMKYREKNQITDEIQRLEIKKNH